MKTLIKAIHSILDEKYKDTSFVLQKKVYILFLISIILIFILITVLSIIFNTFLFTNEIIFITVIDIIGLLLAVFSILLLLKGKYNTAKNILTVYFVFFVTAGCIARYQSAVESGTNNFIYIIFAMLAFSSFFNSRKLLIALTVYFITFNIAVSLTPLFLLNNLQNKNQILSTLINSNSSIIVMSFLSYLLSSITDKALIQTQEELDKNIELNKTLEKKVMERTCKLEKANKKLKELSLLDPLTGLRNRRYFYEVVSEISDNFIANKQRVLKFGDRRNNSIKGKVLGVYLLDIDHFKLVNDTYGHKAGDVVIVGMSNLLRSSIRRDDVVVRWGGEEFLIILNQTDNDYLTEFPKKIKKIISEYPFKLQNNKTIWNTCSIGCSFIPVVEKKPDMFTLENVINISDFALYQAKENGRNKVAVINVKNTDVISEDKNRYLVSLSKDSEVNPDYIDVAFFD